jgi:CRP-like cAMP-binding protein
LGGYLGASGNLRIRGVGACPRIATATCVEDCRLQRITRDRVRELVFQEPRLAFHLIGVVTQRLVDDLRIIEERVSARS